MVTRPDVKGAMNAPNRWSGSLIAVRYFPSGDTSATEFNKFSLGTRTLSNLIRPLSTPFKPILWPQSAIRTLGQMFPSPSLI
nr:Uncharacterised protein [Ipomoea batatas]